MNYPLTLESLVLGFDKIISDVDGYICFRANAFDAAIGDQRSASYRINLTKHFTTFPTIEFIDRSGKMFAQIEKNRPFSYYTSWYRILVDGEMKFKIREGKAMGKVFGGFFDGTPFEAISKEVWDPAFVILNSENKIVLTVDKKRRFFGKLFQINKISDIEENDEKIILLSLFGFLKLEEMY